MVRVLLSFFGGLAVGCFGLYLVCALAKVYAYEHIAPKEFLLLSPAEYAHLVEERTALGMIQVSLSGGLVCGMLCAVKAAAIFGPRARAGGRQPHAQVTREKPLTSVEFERALQSCLFVDLRQRPPAFLQGVLVGRLADSDPELAARIADFGKEHMAALLHDLLIRARIR